MTLDEAWLNLGEAKAEIDEVVQAIEEGKATGYGPYVLAVLRFMCDTLNSMMNEVERIDRGDGE